MPTGVAETIQTSSSPVILSITLSFADAGCCTRCASAGSLPRSTFRPIVEMETDQLPGPMVHTRSVDSTSSSNSTISPPRLWNVILVRLQCRSRPRPKPWILQLAGLLPMKTEAPREHQRDVSPSMPQMPAGVHRTNELQPEDAVTLLPGRPVD
jgi:hypothetical protein